uniref:Lipoprotein n=1 Tax=Schlesneria paludicola TaxID=360056 RepID=A0A7C2NXD1_9PLAN
MTTCGRKLWCVGVALLFAASGCATLEFPWDQTTPTASAKNPVVQITCLWEPSEGRDPDGLPCRGFAGQILFLGNKGGTPVKVDGSVMVYVFDDQGTPEEQTRPIHQFSFDAAAWSQHLRVGTLGPAYHVFIPYTRKGTYEASCSLRVKLTPTEGSPIYSDPSTIPLRGKKRELTAAAEVISCPTPRTSVEEPRGSRTTTIPLDPREQASPTAAPVNEDRVHRLLQEFLKDQATQDLQRAHQTSAISRGYASERIRFDGKRVEAEPSSRQRLLAQQAAAANSDSASPRRNPLSEHPLAEHDLSEHAARTAKRPPARRHPLEDDPQAATLAAEAEPVTDGGIVPAGYEAP